jgi:tricorn protease
MKKIPLLLLLQISFVWPVVAQINAGLFRYPDVSATQIVFTYANDVWLLPKNGGTATKLSSPPGVEMFPKFSPDGKSIAYTANYDGNRDVYVLPVIGGIPVRVTQHSYQDRLVDWTNDGKSLLFSSNRESGKNRFNQFFTVAATGGAAEKLPLAYGDFGSYSPDGKQLALTFSSQAFRNWKRYRGGSNADIHVFNLETKASENITPNEEAANEFPMWHGNYIYFLTDRGPENRMNLWRYDVNSKALEQLTKFSDYDVHFPSLGPAEIVFEQGGKLYLYQLQDKSLKAIPVNVINDNALLKPKIESAAALIQYMNLSPDGNRVLVQARGDVFSVPAKDGAVKNLTMSSGVAERYPSWSPDGKSIAYWSDESGEYELYVKPASTPGEAKKITSFGPGYRYHTFWSPDSKKIAFIEKTGAIKIVELSNGNTVQVDKGLRYSHGQLDAFLCSWSPDSRWLAYNRDLENWHTAVFIYDYTNRKTQQVTSGFYSASGAIFDAEGKYLFVTTSQTFQPYYSDFDNSFIYSNSVKLGAISLKKETPSLLAAKNDTVSVSGDKPEDRNDKKEDKKSDTTKKAWADKKVEKPKKEPVKPVSIDFDGIEQRLVILPPAAGNINERLAYAKGKIIFMRFPNTGVTDGKASLKYYDIDKREEKTILDPADDFRLSADMQKLLVVQSGAYAVLLPGDAVKFEKPIRVAEMMVSVNPMEEWKQVFTDAWRMQRDFFYDTKLHGVNWNQVRERYMKMIEGAQTREDVSFVLGEMMGELSASHTYFGGGDTEKEKTQPTGYLGIDWKAEGKYYTVKKIIRGAAWDAEIRSALDEPGIKVKEGDYILAVNGLPVTTDQEPYAAFSGLAGKTVELTYNSKPSLNGAKVAIVQTLPNEYRLRHLAWIEGMRKRVEEATNGEAGYIFVPSTGVDGQTELMRQLNAQVDKKALIVDERFNDGGQIPDRFIEMLNRTPLAYWAIRDGETWQWPPYANFGPKVMLINGWSGSGGDAFPDYFRKKGLGPLIGSRTWGGLIGISGVPGLIDGGNITVPTFRMYNIDGTWFKEGHGVDPDIDVPEDLSAMAKGIDPQLERAITEIKTLIKTKGFMAPKIPGYEVR